MDKEKPMTEREKMLELAYAARNAVTDKCIENHSTFGMSYAEQIETEVDYMISKGATIPVRCKDCIHRVIGTWARCTGRRPDDFCSDGVRRFHD